MPLPTFDQSQYEYLLKKRREQDAQALSGDYNLYEAKQNALPYDYNLLNAKRTQNQARLGVIGAEAGLVPYERGVNAAQGSVIDRSTEQLGAERGLISLEQGQAGARAADVSLIRGARDNVADKVAVAQAKQSQDVSDERLYNRLGVSAPVSVDVPSGQEGQLGLGTRASLRTQEEVVRGQAADREADRAATLENAKLAVQMQGTNVTEAELMARRAGLSLADARLLVDEAQTRESLAGVDVANAGLDVNQQQLNQEGISLDNSRIGLQQRLTANSLNDLKAPADQGYELYTDPDTRQKSWVTPAEADQLQHAYEVSLTRSRLPETLSLADERTKAQQAQQQAQDPLYGFSSDTDFIQYLIPAVPGNAGDSSQPSEQRLVATIAASLRARGLGETAISNQITQYINAAAIARAKIADERPVAKRAAAPNSAPKNPVATR